MKKGKENNEIGIVASGSKPSDLKFYSLNPISEDYVMLDTGNENERIIYEVIDVDAYNSRMEDMELMRFISPKENYTKYNIYRANAKPLGMIKDEGFLPLPKWFIAPPGKRVKTANTEDIAIVYGVEARKGKQKIGKVIRHENIPVWIDLPILLTTHMAIVGRSGQGKSNLVKIFLRNLPIKYMVFTKVNEYTQIDNSDLVDIQTGFIPLDIQTIKKIFELNNSEIQYCKEYFKQAESKEKINTIDLAENIRQYFSISKTETFYEQTTLFEISSRTKSVENAQVPKFVDSLCKKLESISLDIVLSLKDIYKEKSYIFNMQKISEKEEEIVLYTYLNNILETRRKAYKDNLKRLRLKDRIILFIEEAHNYIPSTKTAFCKHIIQQISREGRKLRIHLVLMSQRPRHLDPTTLSQCGSIVSFNLTNPEDIDYLMANANFYGNYYRDLIRELKIGECTIVSDYISKGISCKVDFKEEY